MIRERHPPTRRGFTLPELLFLTVLVGLLVVVLGTLEANDPEPPPPPVLEEELRALLQGAEHFAAARGRWPESLSEMAEGEFYQPGGEVQICRYRSVPGNSRRAPYILIHAAHPEARRVVFTAYPTWAGRLYDYRTRAPGCSGI